MEVGISNLKVTDNTVSLALQMYTTKPYEYMIQVDIL
jgi:hypothetical protein